MKKKKNQLQRKSTIKYKNVNFDIYIYMKNNKLVRFYIKFFEVIKYNI